MCALELANKLAIAEKEGKLPKVVIPVHFAGLPCDMKPVYELSQKYGFKIIEDACHALGAQYHDQPTGSCQYSDITVFSFHPVKIITTGEGGMAMTNDPLLAKKMRMLRSHGITRETEDFIHEPDGPWYYEQQMLGFNYRMTDIQAALGLSQMVRLEEFLSKRRTLAAQYQTELPKLELEVLANKEKRISAWHLFVIKVSSAKRKEWVEKLRNAGIGVNVHYISIHQQPFYSKMNKYHLGANQFSKQVISLPLYPEMEIDMLKKVFNTIRTI